MKTLLFIIITIFLFSCQAHKDRKNAVESYQKGIESLEELNANQKQNYSKALKHFNESIALNPKFIEPLFWKIQCEIHLKNFDSALVTSHTALNESKFKNHKLIPSIYQIAGILENLEGNFNHSLKYFNSALSIYEVRIAKKPNNIDAITNKATLLIYLDRKEEAFDFINSISLDEENQEFIESFKESFQEYSLERVIQKIKE